MSHPNILSASIGRFLSTVFVLLLSSSMSVAQSGICTGADVEISAQDMYFYPAAIVVEAGTTIGWVNYGGFHDVNGENSSITGLSFGNPESFSLESITGTEEGVCIGMHTFTIPGFYLYDCSSYGHAANGMVANVTVIVTVPGCMNPMACNYNVIATDDDGSCVLIGDLCDDGDPDTLEDVIQADCDCAGTPPSIIDDLTSESVLIYPNPASNYITVDLGDLEGSNTTIKLYDSSSKLVFEKLSITTSSIDVSSFAKGVYTLEISTTEKVLRSQVVVE
jgi:plastocyanin